MSFAYQLPHAARDFRASNPTNNTSSNSTPSNSQNSHTDPAQTLQQIFAQMTPPKNNNDADLEDLLINYNDRFANEVPLSFRDSEIHQTLMALSSKRKPNALLVGPAGVGKTAIVEDIARRIVASDPSIPPRLANATIYELPLTLLMAGASYVGELEQRVARIIDFASNPDNNAIIFIDEIHQLIPQDGSNPSLAKVSQMLKPALARGDMRVIGATTTQESQSLRNDPAFSRRFSTVIIDELTAEHTRVIVDNAAPSYMDHYQNMVTINDEACQAIVTYADSILPSSLHRPDNALTLMDRALADASMTISALINDGLVPDTHTIALTPQRVKKVAENYVLGAGHKKTFQENTFSECFNDLYGQQHVIDKVSSMIIRDQRALFPRTKPLSFLFAGPSGVGKTQVARIIAHQLMDRDPIILDMAEYSEGHSVAKLMGAPPGYVGSTSNREYPLDAVQSNPYQVIVLDEIEKAHPQVRQFFLGALDTGRITTAQGTSLDLSHSIIIATTNAAKKAITASGFGFGDQQHNATANGSNAQSRTKLIEALSSADFSSEFLGRFQLIIGFNQLSTDTYKEIIHATYRRLRCDIAERHPQYSSALPEELNDDHCETIYKETYNPQIGARPIEPAMKQWIEQRIDDHLAAAHATTTDDENDK